MGWFQKKANEDNSIEFLTLKIQKSITFFTFAVFFIIMGFYFYSILKLDESKIELSFRALNIFLPIITTWIGAIIAFYFSKEFSDALIKKINRYKKTRDVASKELNNIETFYKEEKQKLVQDYEFTILELLNQIGKKKK